MFTLGKISETEIFLSEIFTQGIVFLLQILNLILIFKGFSGFLQRMTFTSKCACDDGCVTLTTSPVDPTNPADPTAKPKHKRLSKGSIILIMYVTKSSNASACVALGIVYKLI